MHGRRTVFRRYRPAVLVLAGVLTLSPAASGDDWPQFRGPSRDGISREAGLALPWGDTVPEEVWRARVGAGFSGPAIVGERVFILSDREDEEHAVCLDAASGREIWRSPVASRFREAGYGDGPRTTPTVEDGTLWVLGAAGRLAALRAADGETLWSVELPRPELQGPFFGFTSMPLVVGEHVVVELSGAPGNAVLAFDKRSGELAWRTDAGAAGYASPNFIGSQVMLFNSGGLVALAPGDGQVLWRLPFSEHLTRIAQPLFIPPDLVLVSQGYDVGTLVARLRPNGGAEKVWEDRRALRTLISTSVAVGGLVYGFDNSTLKCIDALTGETRWAKRGGFGNGSLVGAAGQLVVLTENGRLFTVEATGEGFRRTSAAAELFSGRTWTAPAVANGRLFVRGAEELVALDVGKSGAPRPPTGVAAAPEKKAAPPPRDVRAIVARYVETLGGAEAVAAVRSLRRSGYYVYNGERYPFTVYYKRPRRYRFEAVRPDGDVLVQAYDGTAGWYQASDAPRPFLVGRPPVRPMPPADVRLLLEGDGDLEGPLLNHELKGHRVELVGEARRADGARVDHLRLTLQGGSVQDWFLSQDDGTLVEKVTRVERDVRFPGFPRLGPYDRRWHYAEHQPVAGVLWPTVYEREDSPFVRTFVIEETEVNVDVDDAIFSPPSDAVGAQE